MSINLWPWRQQQQARMKKRCLYATTLALLLGFLGSGIAYRLLQQHLQRQSQANHLLLHAAKRGISDRHQRKLQYYFKQLNALARFINHTELEQFKLITCLQQIQQQQSEEIHIHSLTLTAKQLDVSGSAKTDSIITQYVHHISQSISHYAVQLRSIKQGDNGEQTFEIIGGQHAHIKTPAS